MRNYTDAMTGNTIYCELGGPDKKVTAIRDFIERAQTMQKILLATMEIEEYADVLATLSTDAILWDAYEEAYLSANNGNAGKTIPLSDKIWYHLRKLINGYISCGCKFDPDWIIAIVYGGMDSREGGDKKCYKK